MKRASKKPGLQPIRVHDLRHSHASMLIELGFTPLEIADRLGHESVKTILDTYSHLFPPIPGQRSKAGRQAEPVPPDTTARRKHLKLYIDCGILNIKKGICW